MYRLERICVHQCIGNFFLCITNVRRYTHGQYVAILDVYNRKTEKIVGKWGNVGEIVRKWRNGVFQGENGTLCIASQKCTEREHCSKKIALVSLRLDQESAWFAP